ncbi:MAG: hypothetical protein MJZ22_00985 [Candidatus Saccharibacteria bacterium]|nr:hypothetical protein [Candidatus Saccharibacteria bacterium]
MAREINLVPDIKNEMIKALKLRNFILFLCIIVSGSAIAVALIFGAIAGGQQVALNDKSNTLDQMSKAVHDYDDLGDFLTIQGQVDGLNYVAENRNLLSRVFNIISTFQPTNGDKIEISTMTVNLVKSTMTIEAQADAKADNGIDYNVLESFKKSMNYLSFDYGTYVDKNGEEIPSYCIVERSLDGTFFTEDGRFYAYWNIDQDGCNPSAETKTALEKSEDEEDDKDEEEIAIEETKNKYADEYEYESYNGEEMVRIWRTPLFEDWYKEGKIDLDGKISDVPHFESKCIEYAGEEKGSKVNWTKDTTTCMLVPDGEDGITVTESSDGLSEGTNLVLRFTAVISFNPDAFKAANHHLVALGPSGVYNVTDSYTQIQNMFSERAADFYSEEDR